MTDQPADLLAAAVNRLRTGTWIAAPALARPLADWLAHEAAYQLHLDETGQDGAEDSTHALAVARAVLGQDGGPR
ncbi:hypothetical protein ACGFZP_05250 [Kitasatospora sp. NPDC048239]|uniref:hypothetical protein n=1 Tax=Kitasatospora sp. NPDC048239 TaxID=3364046 RepID=UPI003724C493